MIVAGLTMPRLTKASVVTHIIIAHFKRHYDCPISARDWQRCRCSVAAVAGAGHRAMRRLSSRMGFRRLIDDERVAIRAGGSQRLVLVGAEGIVATMPAAIGRPHADRYFCCQ